MGAAPSRAYPSAVATPCTSTPGLAEGAPPSGGQPPATQAPTHSHSKDPPQAQQILTELLAKIANRLLDFRCDHKAEQPSSVRHITTWHVGGWTQPGRAGDDKLKAIKASLHKGPIVLQETHWTHEQSTRLHTLISGIHVVATAATVKNTHPSGGVAIILPVGYEVLTHQTILPGQILAALVQLKGAKLQPQTGPPNFFGHTTYTDYGGRLEWLTANGPKLITELFSKACTASVALLNTLRLTTVSIRQRAIFYGTYCLSKFTYVASYALVTPKDIARMQVLVARAILRRPWIKASHLAGTLRALRIAPMQDPEIAIACAALGLLERRGKEDEELCAFLQQQDTSFEGDRQYDTALIYLKRYLPTLPQADVSTIQQIIKTAAFAQKQQHGPLTQPSYKTGLAKHFKTAMKTSRENKAMEHLRSRTTTTWNAAPSYMLLQALTNLHPRLCGAIPRYALLCWSIGGESDCAFWTRFHKLGRCVCGCGRLASRTPHGRIPKPCSTPTP